MSEENIQKDDESIESGLSVQDSQGEESFQLRINKSKKELSFVNPITGKTITVKAVIEEDDEEDEEDEIEVRRSPLPPDEFRDVLIRLDALGLTWSANVPPIPRFKKDFEPSETFHEEYLQVQQTYPTFPRELGAVILREIVGKEQHPALVGNEEEVQEKINILREHLITREYRSEFFFKHAIKVPYFEDADWEIVIKAHERGVNEPPKSAYALLLLTFGKPSDPTIPIDSQLNEERRPETMTVAVNEYLLDKLIALLSEARSALEEAQQSIHSLNEVQTNEPSSK